MARESFILSQDIASGQLIDSHADPTTNLGKLVVKKIIDTLMLSGVVASGTLTRLDFLLLDQPLAAGPTDIGLLISKQHPLFVDNTANGVPVGASEVRGNLTSVAAIFSSVAMTLGLNTGIAVTPGNFGIGDIVRITGQSLSGVFLAQISNIVGPTLTFVDPGTVNPRIFIEGATGSYLMERATRWQMSWVDNLSNPAAIGANTYSIGIIRRIYLADIAETFGRVILPNEGEAPKTPGGGGGILSGSVTSGFLGDASVVSGSIASGAIGHFHIANAAVQSGNILSGSIGDFHIMSGGLHSGTIASGQIGPLQLGNQAVLSGAIGSGQVASGHLASGLLANISTALTSGQVTSGFLGNSSVLSGSIGSGQVASGHIASGFVAQLISPNDVFRYSLLNRL